MPFSETGIGYLSRRTKMYHFNDRNSTFCEWECIW